MLITVESVYGLPSIVNVESNNTTKTYALNGSRVTVNAGIVNYGAPGEGANFNFVSQTEQRLSDLENWSENGTINGGIIM